MPILKAEPDFYPEHLFDPCDEGTAESGRWWVMCTRPQREKQLMRRLQTLDVGFYCPLIPKRFRSPCGRIQTSYVPLFKGYVFVAGDETNRYTALTTNCIITCLPVHDPERLLADLRRIKLLVDTGAPLTAEDRLQPGTLVRVRSGSFMGLTGKVIRRRGQTRLLVAVDFLQKGASVLLDDCQLEQVL